MRHPPPLPCHLLHSRNFPPDSACKPPGLLYSREKNCRPPPRREDSGVPWASHRPFPASLTRLSLHRRASRECTRAHHISSPPTLYIEIGAFCNAIDDQVSLSTVNQSPVHLLYAPVASVPGQLRPGWTNAQTRTPQYRRGRPPRRIVPGGRRVPKTTDTRVPMEITPSRSSCRGPTHPFPRHQRRKRVRSCPLRITVERQQSPGRSGPTPSP